jgi:serine/threonine protein kinase
MPFAAGENVGPYRIIDQLGQGGMATVFKAYHPALDRYVAIKALHPAIMEDPSFLARFEREAKVVAKLDHPNIVPIYDFAEHEGQPYLVMKFIEGQTLKARLAKGPLSKTEAIKIVEAVGKALAYAHQRGYLHRDIKPSNVLLSPDGAIYLADFGLARIAEAGASTLSGDMLMGTPHYISPEQARGEHDLDQGTDIYSFGVVLYELIVGRVPYNADTPFSIIHDHIYTPLPMPRKINPSVPETIERVLLKALAKERGDRYASVEEMVKAFNASLTKGHVGVLASDSMPLPGAYPSQRKVDVVQAPSPASTPLIEVDRTPILEGTPSQAAPRRNLQWLWVVGGLMVTCLALVGFVALMGDSGEAESPEIFEQEVIDPDVIQQQQPKLLESGDPEAHIRRAEELLAEGDTRGAIEEIYKANDLLLEQERYVEVIDNYRWAADIANAPLNRDDRILMKLAQALFLGAPEDAMWPILDDFRGRYPQWDLVQISLARAKLFGGSPDESMQLLKPILENDPGNPFANAVMVECHFALGEDEIAMTMLGDMLQDRGIPTWLRKHLESLKQGL